MSQAGTGKNLRLRILTPEGVNTETDCDSITMVMANGKQGNEEGLIGIHPGHTDAVISLSQGPVTAKKAGATVLEFTVNGGFAVVNDNTVSIIVNKYVEDKG